MTSVPNLARRVPAISFNVVNATRGLRSGQCVAPAGTRFRQRGPNVSSNGAVRRIGIGTRPGRCYSAIADWGEGSASKGAVSGIRHRGRAAVPDPNGAFQGTSRNNSLFIFQASLLQFLHNTFDVRVAQTGRAPWPPQSDER